MSHCFSITPFTGCMGMTRKKTLVLHKTKTKMSFYVNSGLFIEYFLQFDLTLVAINRLVELATQNLCFIFSETLSLVDTQGIFSIFFKIYLQNLCVNFIFQSFFLFKKSTNSEILIQKQFIQKQLHTKLKLQSV